MKFISSLHHIICLLTIFTYINIVYADTVDNNLTFDSKEFYNSNTGLQNSKKYSNKNKCGENAYEVYHNIINSVIDYDITKIRNEFDKLQTCYPFSLYTQKSYLINAYFHIKAKKFDHAIESLESFMLMYPDKKQDMEYALYLRCKIYIAGIKSIKKDINPAIKALELIQYMENNYPGSIFLKELNLYKNTINNIIQGKELYVIRYYLNHGLYHSALIRSTNLLENKNYNKVFEAEIFYRMAEAFNALNLIEERDIFIKKIHDNHKDSIWYENIYLIQ